MKMKKEVNYLVCSGSEEELIAFEKDFLRKYPDSESEHLKDRSFLILKYLSKNEGEEFLKFLFETLSRTKTITYIMKDGTEDINLDVQLELGLKHAIHLHGHPSELAKMLKELEGLDCVNKNLMSLAFGVPLSPDNRQTFGEIKEALSIENPNTSDYVFTENFMI